MLRPQRAAGHGATRLQSAGSPCAGQLSLRHRGDGAPDLVRECLPGGRFFLGRSVTTPDQALAAGRLFQGSRLAKRRGGQAIGAERSCAASTTGALSTCCPAAALTRVATGVAVHSSVHVAARAPAEGTAGGALGGLQSADRGHLLHNARNALHGGLERHHPNLCFAARMAAPSREEPRGTVSHALQPDASKPERRPRGPQRRVEAAAQEHRGAAAAKRLGAANRSCPDRAVARCRAQDVPAAADAERRPLRRKCFPYGWSASTSGE